MLNAANEVQEDLLEEAPLFSQGRSQGHVHSLGHVQDCSDDKAAEAIVSGKLVHSRPARCVKDLGLCHSCDRDNMRFTDSEEN